MDSNPEVGDSPQVTPQNLESFLADLDQALTWLRSLGVQISRTRFAAYRKALSLVLMHRLAGTLNQLPDIVPPDTYRIAFIQSTDLIEVWKAFEGCGSKRFNQKLRSAVTGPDNPIYENPSGPNARDLLFELCVAAFFRRRKTPVLIGTDKDVILRLGGFTVFAECKRPKRKSGVKKAIRDATSQLLRQFDRNRRAVSPRGFIALDISIIANPQYNVMDGSSVSTISRGMDSIITEFFNEHSGSLEYRRDERILGILAFVKVLAFHTGANRHLDCQKVGMFSHAQPHSFAALLADQLYQRLLPN
jgi:hypothetical protein